MKWCLKILGALGLLGLLGGCAGLPPGAGAVAEKVLAGDVTDAAVERVGALNDRLLAAVERLQGEIARKQARLDRVKCLLPLPALLRYAVTDARREAVARDCGLEVTPGRAVIQGRTDQVRAGIRGSSPSRDARVKPEQGTENPKPG